MSNMSDNQLDKLFKEAAKGFQSPYDEDVWSNVEHKLGGAAGGNLSYFKQVGGVLVGIAVLVSLLIGLQTEGVPPSNNEASVKKGQSTQVMQSQNDLETTMDKPSIDPESIPTSSAKKDQTKQPMAVSDHIYVTQSDVPSHPSQETSGQQHKVSYDPKKLEAIKANHSDLEVLPNLELLKAEVETDEVEKRDSNKLQFAIKAIYSPDLSSVGYFSPDRPGSNFGLVTELYFAQRWFVATGAILSHKIYNTDKAFESYNTQYDADFIDAECRVIDIPLNFGYSLVKNKNHSFFLSTGLSSYIMLSEDYEFESGGYYPRKWSERYENENNHYFGVLNLSFGYERRISQQFFIQLEPFLKSPLDGVGEGKVDLVSTGAMFNLKYIFSKEN